MAALKNISRGLWAEGVVYKFYQDRNWKLLKHRIKLQYGEMDLVFQKDNLIHFVEVKTLHNVWMSFERIKPDQLQRLQRNRIHYSYKTKNKIDLKIVFVNPLGGIEIISPNE